MGRQSYGSPMCRVWAVIHELLAWSLTCSKASMGFGLRCLGFRATGWGLRDAASGARSGQEVLVPAMEGAHRLIKLVDSKSLGQGFGVSHQSRFGVGPVRRRSRSGASGEDASFHLIDCEGETLAELSSVFRASRVLSYLPGKASNNLELIKYGDRS